MPAKAPVISEEPAAKIIALGKRIKKHRKALGVNATVAAEAANISRVTLYRIEKGEPSVTIGAYMNLIASLGMDLKVMTDDLQTDSNKESWIPSRVRLTDYPQLKQLAWQLQGTDFITPLEALNIYERNWRHLELERMEPSEKQLIDALQAAFTRGEDHV